MTRDEVTEAVLTLARRMRQVTAASETNAQVVVVLAIDHELVLATSAGDDTGPVLLGALRGVMQIDITMPVTKASLQ